MVGTALSFSINHQISVLIAALTVSCAVLLQIASNFFNDAIDAKKGADTAERLGPTRVTQAGLLAQSTVLKAGVVAVAIAVMMGIPLVMHGGLPIILIGLSAAFFSWSYTGGPYPLAYHGLGEVFVLIYYGIVAVAGTFLLQNGFFTVYSAYLGMIIGSFGMALIALNNFRDIAADTLVNKRTIAVRVGPRNAQLLIITFLIAPFIGVFLIERITWLKLPLLLPSFALSLLVIKKIIRLSPSRAVNALLGMTSAAQLLFALGLSVLLVIK